MLVYVLVSVSVSVSVSVTNWSETMVGTKNKVPTADLDMIVQPCDFETNGCISFQSCNLRRPIIVQVQCNQPLSRDVQQ